MERRFRERSGNGSEGRRGGVGGARKSAPRQVESTSEEEHALQKQREREKQRGKGKVNLESEERTEMTRVSSE